MPSHTSAPPSTWLEKLKFVGPGIVFASLAVGSGELVLTPRSAALYGYGLVWVAVLTLIFKAGFTEGLARCTVATGSDIFVSFSTLPGPRNWANWLVMLLFGLEALAYGGIALAAGTAVNSLFPGITMRVGAMIMVVLIPFILGSGSYRVFEKVMFGMASILVGGVLYATWNVPVVPRDVLAGLVPSFPEGSLLTVMGLMGWVGAGTTTLLYSSWVREKIGKARDQAEYREWIATVRIDYVVAYSMILLLSLCFIILGTTVLHAQGLVPKREETMAVLSNMLEGIPHGRTIFLVTALFALQSTLLAGVDGKSRAFASIVSSLTDRFGSRISIYRGTIIVYLTLMSTAILFGQPVLLINAISAMVSVGFGLLGFILLFVDSQLPHYARGSILWRMIVGTGSTVFLLVALFKVFS